MFIGRYIESENFLFGFWKIFRRIFIVFWILVMFFGDVLVLGIRSDLMVIEIYVMIEDCVYYLVIFCI